MDPVTRALRESFPSACVVSPRVVRRIVRRERGARGSGVNVPHGRCYWTKRASLTSDVAELPPTTTVILVAKPDDAAPDPIREARRAAFHAQIHVLLEARAFDVATVRARVARVGQTAMDEVRAVLRDDELLLPGSSEIEVWIELVATWLELAYFEPATLDEMFPSVDRAAIEAAIALDLPAIPDPGPIETTAPPMSVRDRMTSRTPRVSDPTLLMSARRRGNVVRAMLDDAGDPSDDLAALCRRVGDPSLAESLRPVVDRARAAAVPMLSNEGRLLFDLQRAAIDNERAVNTVDVLGAATTFFRRPIVRALPATKVVRVARRLRRALTRVASIGLPREQRESVRERLAALAHAAETRLREELRPTLVSVLNDVGLRPSGAAEEVAREKLIDELLDAVVLRGFFGIGDLRDAISRNRLKCDELTLRALFAGDELLSADAALAERLEGVYHRGEIYLRVLQRASSVAFGTRAGRLLSTGLVLPVVGAFVVLEGVQHIVGPLAKKIAHAHVHLVSRPSLLVAAILMFLLVHSARARSLATTGLRALGGVLHAIFVRTPVWLATRPLVVAIATSAPVRLLSRFVLKPALVAGPAFFIARSAHLTDRASALVALVALPIASMALNSAPFGALQEIALDALARGLSNLRTRVVPGVISFILDAVRVAVDWVERAIYRIDEALLFREGEGRVALIGKGLGTALFAIVAFVVRLYVNLLIEPQVNPIKHFPVVTVSHKILLPMVPTLLVAMREPLLPLGGFIANTVAGATVFLLPGVFGFLAWELKENYRLYRASIARTLEPVRIGSHGETMTALLVPGFHSGTIPRLRTALRRNARRIARREPFLALSMRGHTRARTELLHVEEAIARFVEREVIALLSRSPRWTGGALCVASVRATSNRVVLAIARGDEHPCTLAVEEQSGFILAHVVEHGFVAALTDSERVVFRDALAGLYAIARVDFAREELEQALAGAPYDICDEGLVVWPDGAFRDELVYDLRHSGLVHPIVRGTWREGRALDIDALRLAAIDWSAWARAWSERDAAPITTRAIL